MITARTRVAAVIGDPVRHSLSPAIHNAAFQALGLDWVYVALEVPTGEARAAVKGMRALGLAGLNVTMPHKTDVARAVDRLTPMAEALGAVNTVVPTPKGLLGDSTDGEGLVNALRTDEGLDPTGKRFLVLGAGGAARAVVRGLADAGAKEVVVAARRAAPAKACVKLAGAVGRLGSTDEAGEVDVVINATPVGMGEVVALRGEPELPVDPERLGEGQLVVDLVYNPLVTPLVAAARAKGIAAVNGVGMLIHQAALAFRLWTGEDAPLEAMSAGALAALAHPHQP